MSITRVLSPSEQKQQDAWDEAQKCARKNDFDGLMKHTTDNIVNAFSNRVLNGTKKYDHQTRAYYVDPPTVAFVTAMFEWMMADRGRLTTTFHHQDPSAFAIIQSFIRHPFEGGDPALVQRFVDSVFAAFPAEECLTMLVHSGWGFKEPNETGKTIAFFRARPNDPVSRSIVEQLVQKVDAHIQLWVNAKEAGL